VSNNILVRRIKIVTRFNFFAGNEIKAVYLMKTIQFTSRYNIYLNKSNFCLRGGGD